MTLDERIDAYLDGAFSPEETIELERQLADPKVRRALGEELLLRDFLRNLPPEEPPQGLNDRILAALPLRPAMRRSMRPVTPTRAALRGATWIARGPVTGLTSGPPASFGTQETLQGMSNVRFAFGPLATGQRRTRRKRPKSRPWWRRALKLVR